MRSGKAECGLQYAVKRSGSAVGYCALSIKCGTRDEKGFHNGIAHFTEHTIFKGTAHKKAAIINSYLDKLGGELNAYTNKEEIVLQGTVLKEDLPKAASLLFEMATSPTFPEDEIETERGVIIDEIKSYKDSPSDDVYDRFEENLFAGHPLGTPILGTVSSVRKITSEELRRFVHERFIPSRMAFTVVSDKDEALMEKEILALARKFFPSQSTAATSGQYTSGTTTTMPVSDSTEYFVPRVTRFEKTVDKRYHEVNAIIGGTAPSLYQEKERLTCVLLGNILGGPASNSILNDLLRERNGWVYGVECSYIQYSDTGIIALCFGCDKVNLDKCIRAIEKTLTKIQNVPMTERKLKSYKKQLFGQFAIGADNGESMSLAMGKDLISFGKIITSDITRKEIDSITAVDLQKMAQDVFAPDRLSKLIFL